jgi:adenylyl-sulfate kinase
MSENVVWHTGSVTRGQRASITGGLGCTLWLTGLSGSGKSTIAHALERELISQRRATYVVDGDNLRFGLNSDLGFSPEDRSENIRRVGEVARLIADAGVVALVPVISPYARDRHQARLAHDAAGVGFLEVFVDAPLEVCERRDPKGLYRRARRGEISQMTGVDDPYEAPEHPDLVIPSAHIRVEEAVERILEALSRLEGDRDPGQRRP